VAQSAPLRCSQPYRQPSELLLSRTAGKIVAQKETENIEISKKRARKLATAWAIGGCIWVCATRKGDGICTDFPFAAATDLVELRWTSPIIRKTMPPRMEVAHGRVATVSEKAKKKAKKEKER